MPVKEMHEAKSVLSKTYVWQEETLLKPCGECYRELCPEPMRTQRRDTQSHTQPGVGSLNRQWGEWEREYQREHTKYQVNFKVSDANNERKIGKHGNIGNVAGQVSKQRWSCSEPWMLFFKRNSGYTATYNGWRKIIRFTVMVRHYWPQIF